MESIFMLNFEDPDIFVPLIRKKLLSQDENLQLTNIETILKCLVMEEGALRETLVAKLHSYGVMSILVNILYSLNARLVPLILELLKHAAEHCSFYISETATSAVGALTAASACLAKATVEAVPMLSQCISTMSTILNNGLAKGLNLEAMCSPAQVLSLVKLVYGNESDKSLWLLATDLLNIILANACIQQDLEFEMLANVLQGLKRTKEVIAYQEDNALITRRLLTLCATCAASSRYFTFKKSGDNEVSSAIHLGKETLEKAIYSAMMDTIIPRAIKLDLCSEDRVAFQRNLVVSTSALYSNEHCNLENLSTHLTTNGYLKYFLLLSVECSGDLRRNTCKLLSQILMILDGKTARLDRDVEDALELSDTVQELLALPVNQDHWFLPIPDRLNSGMALLTLIYYHYQGTHVTGMISFEYLAARLAAFTQRPQYSARVLKVLWFLFAVAYARQEMPRSQPNYSSAIMSLTRALRQSNLSECYCHRIELMQFCLGCLEFPEDLQRAVLQLWLIQCDGDIKPLLALDTDKVLQHSLFIVLHSDHHDNRLSSAIRVIRDLINANNDIEVTDITWDILPELLSNYHPDKNEYLTVLLELTVISKVSTLRMSTMQHSADLIINILSRKPADNKLKRLLVMQACVLLEESIKRSATEVLEMYVGTHDFLLLLQNEAFRMEDFRLTVTCLKLSLLIMQYQLKMNILCEQSATVSFKNLADLLFRGRNVGQVRTCGLKLLAELLIDRDDELAIRLVWNKDDEGAKAIFNLIEVLYIVTGKVDLEQSGLVYQCLLALFNFCHQKSRSLMHDLCTILTTCHVINYTLESGAVNNDFLHFTSGWLNYRATYCSAEGEWNSSSSWKTPYEETIDRIKEYMDNLDDSKLSPAHYLLRCALIK